MSATPLLRLIQPSITRPGGTRLTTSPASTVAAAAPKVLDLRSVERQVKGGSAEAFAFGPFRLDEPGRVLTLSDREVALQPRVFDLLAYLVRHRERVVSKDELLDTLWPEVTVTENSLQRAVSTLRSALREGGMDSLLKNYPGKGYRFCSETLAEPTPPSDSIHDGATEPAPHRQAIAEQRWADALSLLSALNEIRALDAVELEEWGYALQCLGQPADAAPIYVRAIAAYSETSRAGSAARVAISLSTIHMERNEMAAAKGWAAAAQDILAATPDAPESGYVLWMQAKLTAAEGNIEAALELADAAYNFGQRMANAAVKALALVYRGFYKVCLGRTAEGLADQDRAAALALSQNVGPVTGSVLYCNILWTCRSFGDWARASQWTLGYRQFCGQNRMEFSGSCQLHYAEAQAVRGSLNDALFCIQDSIDRLSDDAPWSLGDAYRVLGDIHHAIGNVDLARDAYDRSYALGWDPEPGYAMLQLELGHAETAYASLERSLIGHSWWTLQRQGMLLAHLALVAAHTGRSEKAQALISDLAGQSERWPVPSIRALTNEASAVLARRQGDTTMALRHLQLARQLWTSIDSRLHAARLRVEIGSLQLDTGDHGSAAVELRAALAASEELGSKKLVERCRQLHKKLPLL